MKGTIEAKLTVSFSVIMKIFFSFYLTKAELVRLNRDDIDFENRECVVFGKGSKERPVYFDARTKIHLKNYLDSRIDDEDALFVSPLFPHKRLEISGVEIRLRELGRKLGITNFPNRKRIAKLIKVSESCQTLNF